MAADKVPRKRTGSMKRIIATGILVLFCIPGPAQPEWEIIESGITEHLHDIEFINDSTGFVYSYGTGNIYRTSDEGSTWEKIFQTDSVYFEQIQFIDSRTGWICGEQGTLLKTTDFGRTWSDLSIKLKDANLLLYGMCFINDSLGYLSGAALSGNSLKPELYTTLNGGTNWTEIHEDIPHMILNLCQKGNDVFATGNGFIIRMGINAGTWEYVFRDTAGIVGQIRDIRFASDMRGMAVSFRGKVLVTNNGGDSFTSYEITTNRLRSAAFLGAGKWIAAGDNNKNDGAVLYLSEDDGESWEKKNDFPDIHRISVTGKNIWIAGKEGFIAKRTRNHATGK